jgi:hypothetical protein
LIDERRRMGSGTSSAHDYGSSDSRVESVSSERPRTSQ